MYRVGEFARIGGVSAKTLRFYDEIGLLRPARTDPVTRYRYYVPEQLVDLARIVADKELGLSLGEIRRPGRRATLERVRERLLRALARAQHSLDRIDLTLAGGSDHTPVVVKRRGVTHVVSLGDVVMGYDDVVEAERELLGRVPERLRGTTRGVLWHQCADAGVPGGEPFVEIRPTGRLDRQLDVKELPAVTVACAYAPDDYDAAERAYDAIRDWMRVRPDPIRLAGPKRELCHGRTLEIQFPLVGD
jgi:DNA-binding transcriptional MerR regulator